MSNLTEVYSAIKKLQTTTTRSLRELLQNENRAEWGNSKVKTLSIETTIRRSLDILIELELIKKEKEGRSNTYSIVHHFPVKSRASEIMGQLKDIFREDEALYAKAQKPIVELLNEIKSPYYIRQNVEDISTKELVISKLEEAINNSNYVTLTYTDKSYKVRPLQIAEFEGIWYLLLFYDKDGSYRKYPITNTYNIEILKEKFLLTDKQDLEIKDWHNVWHQPGVKPTHITLFISKEVIKYFHQKNIFDINSYPERVIPYSDGIEYQLNITHTHELLPQIMYWQPHVIILKQDGNIDAKGKFIELLNETLIKQSQSN